MYSFSDALFGDDVVLVRGLVVKVPVVEMAQQWEEKMEEAKYQPFQEAG